MLIRVFMCCLSFFFFFPFPFPFHFFSAVFSGGSFSKPLAGQFSSIPKPGNDFLSRVKSKLRMLSRLFCSLFLSSFFWGGGEKKFPLIACQKILRDLLSKLPDLYDVTSLFQTSRSLSQFFKKPLQTKRLCSSAQAQSYNPSKSKQLGLIMPIKHGLIMCLLTSIRL